MRTSSPELYFRSNSILGEGPVWADGALHWTDIQAKTLHAKRDNASEAARYEPGVEVGSFVFADNGRMVLATARGFQSFDPVTGAIEAWDNPEPAEAHNRFNDGKCDPTGRFVAGTLNRQHEARAALYLLDHSRKARKIYGPVTTSNGLAWSADGGTLYYIDTPTRAVRAFRYDLEKAELGDEQVVIRIPEDHGKPDGMTIDRDGNLWIALWQGSAVECWSAASGKRLKRVELPVSRVTSCVFGGPDYDTLFITSARSGLSEKELAGEPLAGCVFAVRPGTQGFPAVRFRTT